MFLNYFKIALRNFLKYKGYAIINIFGLGLGMACCILMILYVQDDLSYDRFHENSERIYRVIGDEFGDGQTRHVANTHAPLAPALLTDYPDIEEAVRLFPHSVSVQKGSEKVFQEDRFFFVDANMLKVFSFPLLRGDRATALQEPNSLVITSDMAAKFFGDEDPLDKILTIEGNLDLVVKGVLAPIPANSHFHFDYLANINMVSQVVGSFVLDPDGKSWHWPPMYTYIQLPEAYPVEQMVSQFPETIRKHIGDWAVERRSMHLQPLLDIYLRSELESEIEPVGKMAYVYLFSLVALFVLVIACINFVNLATARSASRAREVGLRKVVGAARLQLVRQFLGESFLYALLAMCFAIAVVELFLPTFNNLVAKNLDLDYTSNLIIAFGIPLLTLLVGVVAGLYPAFILANYKPIIVLQKQTQLSGRRVAISLRSILVVAQFVVSVVLVIVTLVVNQQLRYIQSERLGFDKEHLLVIPIRDENTQMNYAGLKGELESLPDVAQVTAISNFPWEQGYYDFSISGESIPEETAINMPTLIIDHDFVRTMGMEIVAGRDFSKSYGTDEIEGFLINESAAAMIGWDDPLGKRIEMQDIAEGDPKKGRVIGIVRDFHLRSLHFEMDPLVMVVSPVHYFIDNIVIRLSSDDLSQTLGRLEDKWRAMVPNRPFDYFFLDDAFDRLYQKEEKLASIFEYFSLFSIVVGCLGLFGLASFAAQRRTKEIGVRKILGASAFNIILLVTREFTTLVIVAFLVAAPVAAYAMGRWLQDFAYRVDMDWWIFAFAAGLVLGLALITVSFQSLRAAFTNPADTLRYE